MTQKCIFPWRTFECNLSKTCRIVILKKKIPDFFLVLNLSLITLQNLLIYKLYQKSGKNQENPENEGENNQEIKMFRSLGASRLSRSLLAQTKMIPKSIIFCIFDNESGWMFNVRNYTNWIVYESIHC